MAVTAKDGSVHHSAGRASLHDEMHSGGPKGFKKPAEQGKGKSSLSIEEHVKQHGPAHHVSHHEDKSTGQHHVHSMHGDGMLHHSVHGSHEEAHAHMGKAMGLGSGEAGNTQQESPDEEQSEEQYGSLGSGIPGLNG